MPTKREKKKKPVPKKMENLRTVTIMFRDIPGAVHSKFKIACLQRGISMKDRLIELMKEDGNNTERLTRNSRQDEEE